MSSAQPKQPPRDLRLPGSVAEIMASNWPILALLSLGVVIPMLAGSSDVFVWLDRARVEQDHILHHKSAYLNIQFFCVRWFVYFGLRVEVEALATVA